MSEIKTTTLQITATTSEPVPRDAVQRMASALVASLGAEMPGIEFEVNIRRIDGGENAELRRDDEQAPDRLLTPNGM